MKRNLGTLERAIRVVGGIFLMGLGIMLPSPFWVEEVAETVGLLAVVTGAVGYCPLRHCVTRRAQEPRSSSSDTGTSPKQPAIKRILLATDFSGCAEQALEYAAFLGNACHAPVEILYVVEVLPDMSPNDATAESYFDLCRKQAEKPLDELVERLTSMGVTARWRLRLGIPSRQINLAAEELDADLVILGACGRTDLIDVLLGSTAQRVVQGAPCPVLTVHPVPTRRRVLESGRPVAISTVRHVLAPVDFSLCSLDALDYAALLATQFEAVLTVLYVIEPVLPEQERDEDAPALVRGQREQAASRLAVLCHELRSQGIAVETVVGGLRSDGGSTAEAILAEAARCGCDLIVMGTRGRRGLTSLVGGSVAEGVLRQATVPVLTMKHLQARPDQRYLSQEVRIRVGDQVVAGERTH
jgi:nucleotide-binding universal stress UspA family protein